MRHAANLAELDDDLIDAESDFAHSVIDGLSQATKSLPCRFFYDARGSALFEQITQLPEYYPTRSEIGILRERASEIVRDFDGEEVLVEFGSGSSLKTEILLDKFTTCGTYVAIDVSPTALAAAEQRLVRRYPRLAIRPIVADFAQPISLPPDMKGHRKVGFFPGSTIGNLDPAGAQKLLANFASTLGEEARLIVGIDLKKDARTLVSAYNDSAGVTAAFNINLLTRINRELGGTFDERSFRHDAIYNPREGRIEMHLVSRRTQAVNVLGRVFQFREGESIHTENSYKYTVPQFSVLAEGAGWTTAQTWTDGAKKFGVVELIRSV